MEKNFLFFLTIICLVGCSLVEPIGPKVPLGCSETEYLKAINNQDISLCSQIKLSASESSPYYDNICQAQCIKDIAVNKSDPGLCEKIIVKDAEAVEGQEDIKQTGSVRDYCYRWLAEKLNDQSLCSKIVGSAPKRMCEYYFTGGY